MATAKKAPVKKVTPSYAKASDGKKAAAPSSTANAKDKKAEVKKVVANTSASSARGKTIVEAAVEVAKAKTSTRSSGSAGSGQASKKSLSLDVYNLTGKKTGTVSVPAEMFGDDVNKTLLAQAVRVYRANKRQGNASTKTRGEVDGSTRKIYRQKGTGRARHGSVRAPIFVKGGIVFGPRPRDFSLEMPSKMKKKALFSALSAKVKNGELKIVTGLEDITPKTKNFVAALQKLEVDSKNRSILVVTAGKAENLKRASSNAEGVLSIPSNLLNAYEVIKNKHLLVMKDALAEMEKALLSKSVRQAQDK